MLSKTIISKVYFIGLLLITTLVFEGCKQEEKPKVQPQKTVELAKVNFYLDNSASMGGYFNSTEFVEQVSNFIGRIYDDRTIKNGIGMYFASDSIVEHKGLIPDFIKKIAYKDSAVGKSSPLSEILDKVISKVDSNTISIYISDCILSGKPSEIKKDSEYNKTKVSVLRSAINTNMEKISATCGVVLYGFKTSFNGTYYDYRNGKHKINNKARPYYYLMIGHKDVLKRFTEKIENSEKDYFKPELKDVKFGYENEVVKDYHLLSSKHRNFKNKKSIQRHNKNNTITDVEINDKEEIQFGIALDLDALPEYAKYTNYISNITNYIIDNKNIDAKILRVINNEKLSSKDLADHLELKTANPHIIVFSILANREKKIDFNFKLKNNAPKTYEAWSTDDDLDENKIDNVTFSLKNFIEGLKMPFDYDKKYLIDFTIPITFNK